MPPHRAQPGDTELFSHSAYATAGTSTGLSLDAFPAVPEAGTPSIPSVLQDWDRFEVTGFLGQGGMGQVFEAWDVHLRRKVALKFLYGNRPEEAELLLREGRAQALIDHPHVVKIFEAGEIKGCAYLAMQLVPGKNLQEKAMDLPMAERLRVLAQACYGVHAAHLRGLYHRDLKPANILLEIREDGHSHAFVSDFGMARRENGEETLTRGLEGTPAFMSPEQIRREPLDVRSDVYGLGGCLYAILTGKSPFSASSVPDLISQVLHHPPVDPKIWFPDLPADLEAIALRCLAKDPAHRYDSAKTLAQDLERYLVGKPVQARPVTLATRARKWVGRNPFALGGALAAMAIFSLGMAIQTVRIARERTRANQETEMAQTSLAFLKGIFEQVRPSGKQGPTITVKELLDHGRSRVDSLKDKPVLQAEVQEMLGDLYLSFGMYDTAMPLMEQARATFERVRGPIHLDVSRSLNNLANVYKDQGNYRAAEPLFLRSMDIDVRLLGRGTGRVATTLNNLGNMYTDQGRYKEAVADHKQALAIWEKTLGPDHPDVALSLNNLANAYDAQGFHAEAEPLYRRSLAIREKALGPGHPAVADSLNNLANVFYEEGDIAKAVQPFQRALAIRERALGPDHPDVAASLNNLASVYLALENPTEAETLFRRSLAIREKALGPEHPVVAESLLNLASVDSERSNPREAEPLLKRALAIREKTLGPDHPDVAECLISLATLYQRMARPQLVGPLRIRAKVILDKAFGPFETWPPEKRMPFVILDALQGHRAEALADLEKAVDAESTDLSFATNKDLAILHGDPRYQRVVDQVRKRVEQKKAR